MYGEFDEKQKIIDKLSATYYSGYGGSSMKKEGNIFDINYG